MKALGVGKTTIYLRTPERVDKAAAFFSELLNTTFDSSPLGEKIDVHNAWSYDAGIELVAPYPDPKHEVGKMVAEALEKRGEGIHAVVVSVDNAEEARAKAEQMGIGIIGYEDWDADVLRDNFEGRFKKFLEYFLNPEDTFGVFMVLGQWERK